MIKQSANLYAISEALIKQATLASQLTEMGNDVTNKLKTVGKDAYKGIENAQREINRLTNKGSSNFINNIKASLDRNDLISNAALPALVGAGAGALGGAFGRYKTVDEARKGRLNKILSGLASGALTGGALGVGGNLLMKGFGY